MKLSILITREQINARIDQLATQIAEDYRDRRPLILGTLKGSFIFTSDLVRKLDMPVEIDFVRLSSYGSGAETSGKIEVVQDVRTIIEDRHVLVIEDIVDTGLTARFLLDHLSSRQPSSLSLCTLLDKPSRRTVEVPIAYVGFTVPNKFVVGYGIDFDEKFRNLPDVCALED